MLIGDIISVNARKYPQKICLVHADRRLTFSELDKRVNRLAQALIHLKIQPGDRIAMRAKNCPQYVEFYFAAAKCGAVAVPINPFLKKNEFEWQIQDSGSKLVFMAENDTSFFQSLKMNSLGVETVVCLEREAPGFKSYERLLEQSSAEEPSIQMEEKNPAMIVYTSGTTGLPKGVILSHKNCICDARHIVMEMLLELHHTVILIFPLFHTAAISQIFRTYYVGATQVLASSTNPIEILSTIEREKITDVIIVPTLLNSICNTPGVEKYDLRSLRLITYGGAIIPVEQLKQAINIFKCGFLQVLGTTETAPCVTALRVADHKRALENEKERKRLASCGRAMVGVETRVVDAEDREVAPGEVGELCVRGENVMLGYWGKAEETRIALRNGWYHTGDLARMDEEGYIYIVDRIKDIIISGGENIASREIEEVLYCHPAIREVAVIGVPDAYWGEAVKAVVVLKEGTNANDKELIEFCKKRLASFKAPKSIAFVKGLPKSPQGKILKAELRKKYREDQN